MLAMSDYPINYNIAQTQSPNIPLKTNFRGYSKYDVVELGKKIYPVIHETGTFREPKTLKFIERYIKTKFPLEEEKNIIVGACSSGEEAMSLAMLLEGTNTKITGFDISPKIIECAKKHEYIIQRPANETAKRYHAKASCYKDSYLAFDDEVLGITQKRFKNLFDQHFEEIDPKKQKFSFKRFLKSLIPNFDIECNQFDKKKYKLKDNSPLKCDFKTGNILELDKIVPSKSADVITFRNALYHLVTTDICGYRETYSPKETQKIFEKIGRNVNKALKKGGIFVIGENENAQKTDVKLLAKVLRHKGFKHAQEDGIVRKNIWVKYNDIK